MFEKKQQGISPKHISEVIDAALKRKETYLWENPRYRRFE